uniref:Cytochrome b n=1 Tax=Metacrangonyx goulmimensis TaxID=1199162 RepID=K7ZVS1_9CRUS|nr:cytochrome b [Metacrangonyx goulmimensis]CCI69519.1 cytochrome b [Metacrangonyx goulmimensis]
MSNQLKNKSSIIKVLNSTFMDLPAPKNISFSWNVGSLLFLCLLIQLSTGVLLASSYSPNMENSFFMVMLSMEDITKNWMIRYIHANGASLFFVCLYYHISRNIYYFSYMYIHTWFTGVTIFILTMATAFLGYVLPINQMSYWGASVITNLLSEVPYIGPNLIQLVWGSPSVNSPTIMRFFSFHFMLPFLITALTIIHIILLHQTGSKNPLGLKSTNNKYMFNPIFILKDLVGYAMVLFLFMFISLLMPLTLGDDENFFNLNPYVTPIHIQPEWYFLFAYAILRSIPNKMGGIVALAASIFILYFIPYLHLSAMTSPYYPLNKLIFYLYIMDVSLLTWIGMSPVESPYIFIGQLLSISYFAYYFISPFMNFCWEKMILL